MEFIITLCLLAIMVLLIVIVVSLCQSLNTVSDSSARMMQDMARIRDIMNQWRLDTLYYIKRGEPGEEKSPVEKIREKVGAGEKKPPVPVKVPVPPPVPTPAAETPPKPVVPETPESQEKWRPDTIFSEKSQPQELPDIFVAYSAAEAKPEEKPAVKPVEPKPEVKLEIAPEAEIKPEITPEPEKKLESEQKPLFIPPPLTQTPRRESWDAQAATLFEKGWNWFLYGKERLEKGDSVEYVVAANWMVRIGILFLILAAGFFLKHSIEQGWVSPEMRVMISAGSGLAMYLYGLYLFSGKLRLLGQGLAAGGAVVLYFSVYAAAEIFGLISPSLGFLGMSVVTVMLVMSALRRDSILIAVIGTAGAYFTPILFNVVPETPVPALMYLAILAVGLVAIRFRHDWVIPMWISLIGTYVLVHLIMMNFGLSTLQMQTTPQTVGHLAGIAQDTSPDAYGFYAFHHVERFFFGEMVDEKPVWSGTAMCFTCLLFVLLHTAFIVRSLVTGRHGHNWEFTLVMLNSLACCVTLYMLVMKFAPVQYASWVPGGLGAFFLLHAIYFWRRQNQRVWQIISLGMAVMYFAILVPTYFNETRMWILPCWAVEAGVLLWAGRKLESRNMVRVGTGLLILILIGSTVELFDVYVSSYMHENVPAYHLAESCLRLMPERFLRFLIPIIVAALAAHVWRHPHEKSENSEMLAQFFLVATGAMLFVFANGETVLSTRVYYPDATLGAVSVLWMAFSLACIAGGIVRMLPTLRYTGLWLFGITVAKVLLWDMAQSAMIYRIIAFFIVGVLIMIGAALYLKATRSNDA